MTTTTPTTENIKVYELAKELGLDSFSLLDKLKSLSIPVKSHMSELSSQDAQAVRDSLKPQPAATKGSKSGEKKAVVRRTATAGGTATAKPAAAPKATETKAAAPKTSKATTTKTRTTKAAKTAATPEEASDAKKASTTVIRRRTTSTGEVETVVKSENPEQTLKAITKNEEQPAEETFQDQETSSSETFESKEETTVNQGSGLKMHSLLQAKKDGLTGKNNSSILTIIKEEPRKAIVKPAPAKPGTPAAGAARPPVGIINYGKEAIDKMAEEESAFAKKRSRFDREKEGTTDMKIQDYRAKKELVFLPKRKKISPIREVQKTQITKPSAHKRVVKMQNQIVVSELAAVLGVKVGELLKKLIGMGMMATINQSLDMDTATLIATEYGFEVENVAFKEENVLKNIEDAEETLKPRPPIVTIMGHVDHGKTSLLDALRTAKVAEGEAGGITQHLGAYTVELDGKFISFIDTPGHEAFTQMRARGANVTDIVILVVAADDGVMPQTKEALSHAKAAGVPIIVAVNKIDKPTANPERVYKELAELDLLAEEWGGQTMFIKVSALKKTGLKELLEGILLQAEILDLKANENRLAEGVVLEARLDKNRGPVASILIKKGTLKVGDHVVAGQFAGKVRSLLNEKSAQLKQVGPSYAAELLGLEGVPIAGDTFNAVQSDAEAQKVASFRAEKNKVVASAPDGKMTLDQLFSKVQQGDLKELPLILKTDVFGSAEAIKDSLSKISNEKVKVKVIYTAAGGITESDVMLASASNAVIIGFGVRPETKAMQAAEAQKIEIKTYSIIYELIDDVKKAMAGLLDKKAVETYLGRAEVREVFSIPKIGTIAGTMVIDGKITRGCQVRLLRDSRVIYTGKLGSLRRFKDDAKEVAQGYECGIGIENFNDVKQGDIIEGFIVEMIAQDVAAMEAPVEAIKGKKENKGPQQPSR